MKKIFLSLCLFYSCNAFAVIEAVAPIREDWSNQWTTASINHFPDGTSACNALLLYFNVSNKVYTLSSFVINPFFPDIGTCNFSGMQNGVALPYAITRVDTVSALHICPTPPNLPFFVYNQTTFLCERENPCASQSLISTGWAIGTAPVGQVTTFCAFPLNCTTTQTVLRSALGMSIVNNNRDGTSCLPDSAVLPPDALKVTLSPSAVPIENKSPADTAVFDQLVADKAAADAKSAAAAAASANATAATAAQAAADQAAADAYIASVIARANALKSGLPVLNVPSSPTSLPVGGGTPTATGGGSSSPGSASTTGGVTLTTPPASGTATCATFSICNVENYLNDIKQALGVGADFSATAAAADAKVATMETDGQTALKKVGDDAATQEGVDESLIKSAFQIPALRTTCTPITKIVMGSPLSIDLCFYTEIIRQIIAFLFGLFGAFTVYQIAFRKN